jgi:hypothetical protein
MAPHGDNGRSRERSHDRSRASAPTGSVFMPFKKTYCVTSIGCLTITLATSVALTVVGFRGSNPTVITCGILIGLIMISIVFWYISMFRKRRREFGEEANRTAQCQHRDTPDIMPPTVMGGVYAVDVSVHNHGIAYNMPAEYSMSCHSNMDYLMDPLAPPPYVKLPPPYDGVLPPAYEDIIKDTQLAEVHVPIATINR